MNTGFSFTKPTGKQSFHWLNFFGIFLVGSIITLLFRASSKFRLIYCFFLVKSCFFFIEKVHILRIILVNVIALLVFGRSTYFLVGSIIPLLFRASLKFRLIYCFFLVKSWVFFIEKVHILRIIFVNAIAFLVFGRST